MEKMGVILNFKHGEVTIFDITKQMIKSAAGHPMIRVFPNIPRANVNPGDIEIISVEDERFAGNAQKFELTVNNSGQNDLADTPDNMNNGDNPVGEDDENNSYSDNNNEDSDGAGAEDF